MFYLGCGIEGDLRRHHDPHFDVNEESFPVGVAIPVETALRYLRGDG
jgi:metal-dependent amidase/aminoacylase/carboxypeptidase family protein